MPLGAQIYTRKVKNSNISSVTRPYVFMDEVVAVPPGEEYDGYEKLLLPFDVITWALICVVFVIAFLVVFIINHTNVKIRNLVFGQGVATPSLNIVQAFFGISQIVLPARYFARFLALWFITYCLIIRTAYQGKMFEFLQKEMLKPQINSLEELMAANLTLYTTFDLREIFDADSDLLKR